MRRPSPRAGPNWSPLPQHGPRRTRPLLRGWPGSVRWLHAAIAAAQQVLTDCRDVTGEVRLVGGRVQVRTTSGVDTVFLSLIGITRLSATGSAEAELVANR